MRGKIVWRTTSKSSSTSDPAATPPAGADPARLAALLFEQLENADGAAIQTAEELKAALDDNTPAQLRSALNEIFACVERFAFDAAKEKLQPLMTELEGTQA